MMTCPLTLRLIGRSSTLATDRRGNAAIELALAAPAFFLFMLGTIEVGYALWMQNALDYSVAAAARCASLNGNACAAVGGTSQVTTYAANQSGAYLDNTAFTYTPTASCGCHVTGAYTIALDIPWDNALSVNLSSSACLAPPPSKSCAS
jgi:Flp pilus assembly protein TadG